MKRVKSNRGFTLIELMIVVTIISMLAAVAIPSFLKYVRRSQTTEVVMNIRKMFDSAAAYYYSDHANTNGGILARQFPASAPTWAPPIFSCCGQPGGKCAPNVSNFTNVTWTALNFSIDVPHYYQYWFASSGTDLTANFLTYGVGDLDCDYTSLGIYYRIGAIGPDRTIQGSGLVISNELE